MELGCLLLDHLFMPIPLLSQMNGLYGALTKSVYFSQVAMVLKPKKKQSKQRTRGRDERATFNKEAADAEKERMNDAKKNSK